AVALELGGLTDYDQLNAYDNPDTAAPEGTFFLAGRLDVSFYNGYDPAGSSFFDVFTAIDIVDLNPLYNLPALDAGLHWEHAIVTLSGGREALRLTAAPLPGTLALLAAGGLALGFTRRRA